MAKTTQKRKRATAVQLYQRYSAAHAKLMERAAKLQAKIDRVANSSAYQLESLLANSPDPLNLELQLVQSKQQTKLLKKALKLKRS